jgi:polysaccharide export outer membrane protein
MKKIVIFLLIFFVTMPAWGAEPAGKGIIEGYAIGPGDVLEVSVWKNEALTRRLTVLPDGRVSFPLAGDIDVAGRTVAQVRSELEKKLARFIKDPILSVLVQQVNSLHVYVIGKVNRPGRLMLNTDINVMQALSMAGGLNTYAKRNDIKIFREGEQDTAIFIFEYDDVAEGKKMEQNIRLMRGDVVVVP